METLKDFIVNILGVDSAELIQVNPNVMAMSVSTKKKPGFLQVAVDDETARKFMHRKSVAYMIVADRDEVEPIINELSGNKEAQQ